MSSITVDSSSDDKATLSTQLVPDPSFAATVWLTRKNDTEAGDGKYVLVLSSDTATSFYALTPKEFDAFKGTQDALQWTLYLSPNEWRKVAADAGT